VHQTDNDRVTLLDQRLRHFTRRNTTDFFVHQRLREFLTDELEFYVRDQVVHVLDLDADAATLGKKRLAVRVFRRLAERIIDFLARLEDAQKTLFEKRKFALATDWLVPIQHVPHELWAEIAANTRQVAQWREWFAIQPRQDLFNPGGAVNAAFFEQHPTLVVDTRCFDAGFRLRLLAALSATLGDLDNATDGILVHSENFQALNYLLPRFEGQVRCVYVDRLLEKSPAMLDWARLDRPFDYTLEVLTDAGLQSSPVDLGETFNALYGLRVERFEVWTDPETQREYRAVKARNGDSRRVLVVWRNVPPESEADRDRRFLEEKIGDRGAWDEFWTNGPCAVPGIRSLDSLFKRLVVGKPL
jgi:hypothetical protein